MIVMLLILKKLLILMRQPNFCLQNSCGTVGSFCSAFGSFMYKNKQSMPNFYIQERPAGKNVKLPFNYCLLLRSSTTQTAEVLAIKLHLGEKFFSLHLPLLHMFLFLQASGLIKLKFLVILRTSGEN